MKINFFLIIAMALYFSCKADSTTTLNGKWKLIKYHNLTVGTSEIEPTNISRSIIIDFSDNEIEGKMNGHTVSNSVSGDYKLLTDNKMKTLNFGGTKVNESKWGNKFWDAILSASSYERQSTKLFMYFNGDKEKMEFERQ